MLAQSYGKAITSHLDSNVWKVDTNNLDDTSLKRALATNSRREAVVITSYSIHYTKLYDFLHWPVTMNQ